LAKLILRCFYSVGAKETHRRRLLETDHDTHHLQNRSNSEQMRIENEKEAPFHTGGGLRMFAEAEEDFRFRTYSTRSTWVHFSSEAPLRSTASRKARVTAPWKEQG